jgi:hypothetical protein
VRSFASRTPALPRSIHGTGPTTPYRMHGHPGTQGGSGLIVRPGWRPTLCRSRPHAGGLPDTGPAC